MAPALLWFRRDLRLADHAALDAALAAHGEVVPVYVHSPAEDGPWAAGSASRWWLHGSLAALDAALRARGSRLVLLHGPTLPALLSLARAVGAGAVHWSRRYEPDAIALDARLKVALRAEGLACASHGGALLCEPWEVRNLSGDPYRVYGPFARACRDALAALAPPTPAPARMPLPEATPAGVPLAALALRPRIRWDAGLAAEWCPGEDGAHARLAAFLDGAVGDYVEGRDRPDRAGTSRLAPHLHFGELSPRQAVVAATSRGAGDAAGAEAFVRQLVWREFARHLLYHWPRTATAPVDARFEAFGWREDPAALEGWRRGRTGVPLVDAGLRELWHTGWMHNRVRMVVASWLTKHLGLHWLEGQRWFHDTLVDADLANNALGWQWVAGCGADAAPYHRVFNPALQGERHDPQGAYVRRWVPELTRLPDRWLHRPWEAPAGELAAAGVRLGADYPRPAVDLVAGRIAALARLAALRGAANPAPEPARNFANARPRLQNT